MGRKVNGDLSPDRQVVNSERCEVDQLGFTSGNR